MSVPGPDIDALIEEGLTRYGRGDLDGALLVWEEALAADPSNEQANSYVDYVRLNYDLLSGSDAVSDESVSPFGIADDEYQVEIIEGTPPLASSAPAPLYMDPLDEGWFIDEDTPPMPGERPSDASVQVTSVFVIEADEPPAPAPSDDAPTFDSETREYDRAAHALAADAARPPPPDAEPTVEGVRPLPDDDDDAPEISVSGPVPVPHGDSPSGEFASDGHTPGFGEAAAQDSTPVGFAAQATDVRVRDLGFVQAVKAKPVPDPVEPAAAVPEPAAPEPISAPEIEIIAAPDAAPGEPEPAQSLEPISAPEIEILPGADEAGAEATTQTAPVAPLPPLEPRVTAGSPEMDAEMDHDKPASPPPPATVTRLRGSSQPPALRTPTREKIDSAIAAAEPMSSPGLALIPDATSTATDAAPAPAPAHPAHADEDDDLAPPPSPSALTRELPMTMQMPVLADERNRTRDLQWEVGDAGHATQRLPIPTRPPAIDVSAPTRELGLRPTRNDIITARLDARSGRAAIPTVPPLAAEEGTRADIVSPFEPMDSRSAQILDDIDEGAPDGEAREDRTRRRITALIERAVDWQRVGELEKAVSAIDLALAEDPNSALAQKLIHRNRDAIMAVFQAFVGDLQRAPLLARPLHELASAPISPRAAFLLSRVDGTMSIDEILDVSGMPRLEAYRYLCQLLLRGILR